MQAAADQLALTSLDRTAPEALRAQLERALRDAVRAGALAPGARLPSTRALAADLGVSRGVAVDAYGQLVAEGYLQARQGAPTRVAPGAQPAAAAGPAPRPSRAPAYDFSLGIPDLAAFPRAAWGAALRRVLREAPDSALGHPDPRGARPLRDALAAYLGRVRGVACTPRDLLVCNGFAQGLALTARALRDAGVREIAMEDPGFVLHRWTVEAAGLRPVPVAVDGGGLRVDALEATRATAVLVAPAHASPSGSVLAPERRTALVAWARERDAVLIEDDYDAEFRFDREPVGALQGLAPERTVYGGTASKTLAPALRLGWLVLPARLADTVRTHKVLADGGSPVLDQLALADLLGSGLYDRHLRRRRLAYRRRRDALVAAVAVHLPGTRVAGVPAGLHAMLELPPGVDEQALVAAARALGVAIEPVAPHRFDPGAGPPGVLLGFAALPEPAIRRGVALLGEALAELS